MRQSKPGAAGLVWLALLILFASHVLFAEQLPIRTYTTSDGLARDNVNQIVRDSRGFLWFCTEEGLSRFDGYQFTNYTTNQGLPHRLVSDILETRDGEYWIATGGGLSRFNPTGTPLFTNYHPSKDQRSWNIEVLKQDRNGTIWIGTDGGLYRMNEVSGQPQFEFVDIGMPAEAEGQVVQALIIDNKDALWVGTRGSGLYRREANGRIEHYAAAEGLPDNRVNALIADRDQNVWAGTIKGLVKLTTGGDPSRAAIAHVYAMRDGLPSNWIETLFQSSDGKLWIGTDSGLSDFQASSTNSTAKFRTYTTVNGLSSHYIMALAEDKDGDLWLGTDSGGAMKLARTGFTTYTETDGLGAAGVDALFEDRQGELCAVSSFTKHFINKFDGRRFKAIWPDLPRQITNFGWGWNQVTLQDHAGEWWVPTGEGLVEFPAIAHVEELARTKPKKVYTTADGLAFNDVFRLYEDSRGDIWISTLSAKDNGLSRWDRSTGKMVTFSAADGLTSLKESPVTSFAEDTNGNLWLGHLGGGLTRYSQGRFKFFSTADGLPAGTIRALYSDRSHRLWIASSLGGLARLDNPADGTFRVVTYTTAQGLSSNDVWCITEDQWSHIYVGTGRGLDQLDSATGRVKHYSTADGLLVGKVTSAFRDGQGALWFASNVHGLSRFVPAPDPHSAPPLILISGLRIAGVDQTVSQLGATEIPRLELKSNQNQLNIDFVGLSYGPGEDLRYEYQLEGADQDWSDPRDQRSVNYANLAPGRYRFLVRAVNTEGLTSVTPAVFSFTIMPPIYQRWWFVLLAAMSIGLIMYALYRQRLTRLLELERVRTRIATDLHDDIGANLSLIAVLSEVARGQTSYDDSRLKEWLATIAMTSRDTVDSMSDIVWAVNPKRDHLRDLTRRMRRFADDIFAARNIEFQFHAPELGRDIRLSADLRREVFLIFKETINNAMRHSGCTRAEVDLHIAHGQLVLRVSDNGRGLNSANADAGTGLASMRSRARKLGGSFEASSRNGAGTIVTLDVPLDHRPKP